MQTTFLYVFLSLQVFPVSGQVKKHFTISGYVKETVSGESLIGVNIHMPDQKTGTTTNNYGFYSLTLPESDSVSIIVSYVGYNPEIFNTALHNDIELNFELKPNNILDEVIITAGIHEKQSQSAKMSTVMLQREQIRNVPSILGEKDVLKVLQLMPGVQKGTEGSSGLYVRGGGPDQNLVILDDAVVYNVSHLFGFFSLFNGDALKNVELTKGGFPARFGGRLSSVLEMNMKEGNKEVWHGEGGIGLISSRFTIDGPIKKGKSSIVLSGRRTYADLIAYPFLKKEKPGYYFYDFNAKVNYDFGRKDKLYLSGYFGKDRFSLKNKSAQIDEKMGFRWGNSTATLRWNHLFSGKLFSNTSAIFSNYDFGLWDKYKVLQENKNYYAEYYSGIRDLTLKYDLDLLPNPSHWIRFGAVSTYHRFNPHAFIEEDNSDSIHTRDIRYTNGIESGLYFEDTWKPAQFLSINAGVRFSHFLADIEQYRFLEPRLTVSWKLRNDYALKGSYASMNQYIHLLSNTGINLPTDLWVPATDRIKPQQSRQAALGLFKDFSKNDLSLSIEAYYKKMANVVAYKEGATFLTFDNPGAATYINWEDNITSGKAWSYGVELLLQKKTGRFSGWIGYTLSWTQMQFDSINFGKKYWARYDRRHDLSVVATYRLNNHITFSGSWVYGTGNAITLPASKYYMRENFPDSYTMPESSSPRLRLRELEDISEKNNFRMAPYHRLDLGIQFHKEKTWGERIWEISVYNAYNRRNPFYYYRDEIHSMTEQRGILRQVNLFPVIPSVTYSFKF